ncbi:BadF-type ATPase [Actinacidiphila rubida]|uniref:BadF-type ATPase n=1 Tax=Actinacidiphila rubida TaxID=310780 RepID=A0A1H8KQ74_9ACTN|nr:BadF/BadG/BcrA/BcrD ATPase family protein [Actinacidiphila rubida]SEN94961.1 BadF-type ATPase [Actinacidiphila rubida]
MSVVLAVDLGKTGCRAQLWAGAAGGAGGPVAAGEAPGAPGLAESGGVAAALASVLAAAGPLLPRLAGERLAAVCVGAAGAAAAPDAARELAGLLLEELPTDRAAVASDAVTAHAGALDGAAGVVLAAGTGAVAIGLGDGGAFARVDGWGPWLGDEGSGAWIGRAGLRAALRAHDGRGPATALTRAAAALLGPLDQLPNAVGGTSNPARAAASFAPSVAGAAAEGDPVASAVLREAAAALAEAVVAAARAVTGTAGDGRAVPVALTGGLTHLGAPLTRPLHDLLARSAPPLEIRPALGDPLDGARRLALGDCARHEPFIVRADRADRPGGTDRAGRALAPSASP